MATFRAANPKQSFPELEENILSFWRSHRIFERSLEERKGAPVFSFFEGPPTANGKPGVHHVLARVFKDIIPRYKSMQGYFVPRKAGWDCHGLPVEVEVEKKLGLTGKKQIESYGVEAFNAACRESVLRYIDDWNQLTERIGFWVNTDEAYRTLDNNYIESCWALVAGLAQQGLLQRDYKIVKHCPRCETSLAEAEASQGMKDHVEDPAVTVKLPLLAGQSLPFSDIDASAPVCLLIWTTTPWTLGANVAVALHPTASYALAQKTAEDSTERYLLLADRVQAVLGSEAHILARVPGSALAGLRYQAPYAGLDALGNAAVLAGEYVKKIHTTLADLSVDPNEGTGMVHIAPAYGDLEVGKKHGLPVLFSAGLDGKMLGQNMPWSGVFFKEADTLILKDLKQRSLLLRSERTHHSYPFCWRCDAPLMYFAKESWYIRTTARKEALIQANQEIQWIPSHIREGRFGDWLQNNVDWAISRERYWATPLPLWSCSCCGDQVWIGSAADLSRYTGRDLQAEKTFDLHRPYVDGLSWPCQKAHCPGEMRRAKEVIDCWFDSGAMPYAQHHMPFENQAAFLDGFPADFICEGVDQTRGWFYTLHALAVLTQQKPAYKTCIALGHILDEQGRKMSKRLGNMVDPWAILNEEGADALRYYLVSSSQPGQARRFSQALVKQGLRQFLLTLWNCYSFFTTYAEVEWDQLGKEVIPFADRPSIDRWMLGRMHEQVAMVTQQLDNYDMTAALRGIAVLVDDLSNWYIRRNRDRFWSTVDPVNSPGERFKRAAYQTLHECLVLIAQLLAPFLPFVAEELWQKLMLPTAPTAPRSVHLTRWPTPDQGIRNSTASLLQEMAWVLQVVNLGRSIRVENSIKLRQPLSAVRIQAPTAAAEACLRMFEREIKEELNVETVEWESLDAQLLEHVFRPNLPKLGKKLGKHIQWVQGAMAQADDATKRAWAAQLQREQPLVLQGADTAISLTPEEVLWTSHSKKGLAAKSEAGWVVALRTEITPELQQMGLARELVRTINELRKQAGCNVSDTVQVGITTTHTATQETLHKVKAYLAQETLSRIQLDALTNPDKATTLDIDEETISITLSKKQGSVGG